MICFFLLYIHTVLEKFVRENALAPVLSTIVEEADSRLMSRAKTEPQDLDVKDRWGGRKRKKWETILGRLEEEAVKMKIGAKGVGRKKRGRVPGCTSAELRLCSYRLETCPRFFREASGTPLQATSRLLGPGFESLLGMKIGLNELRKLKEKDAEMSHSAQIRGATSINLTHSAEIADTRYATRTIYWPILPRHLWCPPGFSHSILLTRRAGCLFNSRRRRYVLPLFCTMHRSHAHYLRTRKRPGPPKTGKSSPQRSKSKGWRGELSAMRLLRGILGLFSRRGSRPVQVQQR